MDCNQEMRDCVMYHGVYRNILYFFLKEETAISMVNGLYSPLC